MAFVRPVCPSCQKNPLASPDELAQNMCAACYVPPPPPVPEVPLCRRCKTRPPADHKNAMCAACFAEAHESRRPPGPCARCAHRVLIRATILEEGRYDHRPLTVAVGRLRAGALEVYVCRACGFVDWYALDPGMIPIGPEHGTTLVEAEGDTPYR